MMDCPHCSTANPDFAVSCKECSTPLLSGKKARTIDESNISYIYEEAEIYALLGKPKEPLKALQESLEKHYPAEAVAPDPNVDNLRSSPEFNDLIKKYSAKKP